MPWIVKLDKDEDFIGRWALEFRKDRPSGDELVGFTMANGHVPTEGAAIVDGSTPIGQVTSSRFSPKLGRVIGLAWVPSALALQDAAISISDNGTIHAASVTTQPHYDPEGEVLRS